VYRGECIATGEPVIIKCVEKQGVNDTVVSAIRNEVEFSFDSDGLPKILAYFETETDCILIKQLQPGVSLTDHWSSLKKKERIPFIQAFTAQLSRLLD